MMVEWLARRALLAWARDGGEGSDAVATTGRLLYVAQDATIHDLGRYTPDELEALRRATDVSYRQATTRERTYLAPIRATATRLATAARRLPRP